MTHFTRRSTAAAAASAIAIAITITMLVLASGATTASGADRTAPSEAAGLAAAPALDRSATASLAGAQARHAAERQVSDVPLPEGGTVNGIRWEEAQGSFSFAEVETVVEYNAFCQWLRAARDGRQVSDAKEVLEHVPQWPGFRDQPGVELIRLVIAESHAGGGAELEATLADCDLAHAREVRYAEKLGLPPSS